MASLFRIARPIGPCALRATLSSSSSTPTAITTRFSTYRLAAPLTPITPTRTALIPSRCSSHSLLPSSTASFHITAPNRAGSNENEPPPTDFAAMDVLGSAPVPSTVVDICMSEGFKLNSGATIVDGQGVILVGGEAFVWQPWLPRGGFRLLNQKGQWDVPGETMGLLGLIWPRPDLLVLGVGPEMRPISPELRQHISSLGMRVEVLDTRNAAAHFNMLATERGVNEVAAALIPLGWKEGIGANW
ncbi:hypothetical protein F5Y16DRAFT_395491 [Xylariaceae sp. FL0255]|nr:hypothetical protein F5Y16DRAFT_395491 [Xylariaceae sp. FL0255]